MSSIGALEIWRWRWLEYVFLCRLYANIFIKSSDPIRESFVYDASVVPRPSLHCMLDHQPRKYVDVLSSQGHQPVP